MLKLVFGEEFATNNTVTTSLINANSPLVWDGTMLGAADAGFLFHAPPNVIAEFPQFPALDTYDDLLATDLG